MFNIHEIDDDYDVFVAFETMKQMDSSSLQTEIGDSATESDGKTSDTVSDSLSTNSVSDNAMEQDETDEQFIPFDKLIENGIGVGSILKTSNNNYYLIRDGFPKEFNVALCCNKLVNGDFHLYQLGFHWCGSTDSFKFRLITEYEKCCFIDTCVAVVMNAECYDENNDKWNAFNVADCSQILGSLYRYGLIDNVHYLMINDLIKRTHKVDLIKYFDKHYNGRAALYEMIN